MLVILYAFHYQQNLLVIFWSFQNWLNLLYACFSLSNKKEVAKIICAERFRPSPIDHASVLALTCFHEQTSWPWQRSPCFWALQCWCWRSPEPPAGIRWWTASHRSARAASRTASFFSRPEVPLRIQRQGVGWGVGRVRMNKLALKHHLVTMERNSE